MNDITPEEFEEFVGQVLNASTHDQARQLVQQVYGEGRRAQLGLSAAAVEALAQRAENGGDTVVTLDRLRELAAEMHSATDDMRRF